MLSPSSISSSSTVAWSTLRLPRAALFAAGLLLAVEAALHLFAPWLPTPVVWGHGESSTKVAQVQALAADYPHGIDLLILGPSHGSVGISPMAMRAALPDRDWIIYNGALNGRNYPVLDFIFHHVYLPTLQPRALVIAVNPITFNANRPLLQHNTAEFFQSPMPQALRATGLEKLWRIFLAQHLALYRYRSRAPHLADGCVGGEPTLDPWGYHPVEGTFDQQERQKLLAPNHPYNNVWHNYDFGGAAATALTDILATAENRQIAVVLVNMPFRPALFEVGPDAAAGYADYLASIKHLRDQYDFTWFDYQQLDWTDADFRDADHLNTQGAVRLSQHLARDLNATLQLRDIRP